MTQASPHRYLRPEDMRRVTSYEFAPKALVEGYFSGRHRSMERGSSTEFRDYRPYTPGDDVQRIDWRVFARTDRHYLRNYHQETSMNCHILLDGSASMGFGESFTKLDYASFFAAALSYLVVRGKDRVSLGIFDDRLREFFPLGSTGRHLTQLLNTLEKNRPGNRTAFPAVLRQAAPLIKGRGSLVILSDFLEPPGEIFEALNTYLHRGFRLYLFQILDPLEIHLPDRGLASFDDLETGEKVVTHSREIGPAYEEAFTAHQRALRALARRRQIHLQTARTDTHYFQLFDVLVQRPR